MRFVPSERHLLRARDLVDARYQEPLGIVDLARTVRPVARLLQPAACEMAVGSRPYLWPMKEEDEWRCIGFRVIR